MSQLPEHFSRDTFERLIGRALKPMMSGLTRSAWHRPVRSLESLVSVMPPGMPPSPSDGSRVPRSLCARYDERIQ
jgi:hypothetical protein